MTEEDQAREAEQEEAVTDPSLEAGFSLEEGEEQEAEQQSAPEPEDTRDYEAEAREMGWVPESEWRGDKKPPRFLTAEEFVERGQTVIPILRKQLAGKDEEIAKIRADFETRAQRLERMSEETQRRQKAQHEAEIASLRQVMRKAAETGDMDEYDRVSQQLDTAIKSAPAEIDDTPDKPEDKGAIVREWVGKNPWYQTDFDLANEAKNYSEWWVGNNPGKSVQDELAAVEAHVKNKYPEKFGMAKPQTKPKPNGGMAAVDGGGAFAGATQKNTLSVKLNKHERAQADRDVAAGIYKDVEEWASVYFA